MNVNQKIHQAKLSKWTNLFSQQSASGLTIQDWCDQQGISRHSFYYWKRRLKDLAIDSCFPDIVPISPCLPERTSVSLSEEPSSFPQTLTTDSKKLYNSYNSCNTLLLSTHDLHLEFGPSVPDSLILEILKAVRHA